MEDTEGILQNQDSNQSQNQSIEPEKDVFQMSLMTRLSKVKQFLLEQGIEKSGDNTVYKYKYPQLKDFMPYVLEAFEKYSVFGNVALNENIATIRFYKAEEDCLEFYIETTVPFYLAEISKGDKVKGAGASSTYYRRYLYLQGLDIVIDDEVDSDKNSSKSQTNSKAKQEDSNKEEIERAKKGVFRRLNSFGYNMLSKEEQSSIYYNNIVSIVGFSLESNPQGFYAALREKEEQITKVIKNVVESRGGEDA